MEIYVSPVLNSITRSDGSTIKAGSNFTIQLKDKSYDVVWDQITPANFMKPKNIADEKIHLICSLRIPHCWKIYCDDADEYKTELEKKALDMEHYADDMSFVSKNFFEDEFMKAIRECLFGRECVED